MRAARIAILAVAAGCAVTGPGPGDAARGREIVASRDANCLLCHVVTGSGARAMGDLGPPLDGVGARMNEAELRLRVRDSLALNPETIMPPYGRILSAQQIEDTVAYLRSLR